MVAIIYVLIAIASIQLGASLAKQLFPVVGPLGTTTLRLLFAAIILVGVWRPWRKRFARADLKVILAYGAALGMMNILFYLSLSRIPLGIAVALEFTGPLAVAVFGSKRKRDLVWVACALAGILLLLPFKDGEASLDPIGIALALIAGIFWASYIIFGQRAGKKFQGGMAACLGMIVAAAIVVPIGIYTYGAALFRWEILPLAFGMAMLSSALPYSLEMLALKEIPASTFSILMSLEPAAAALCGFLFLHESLSPTQLLAIALVIIASAGSSIATARARRAPPVQV